MDGLSEENIRLLLRVGPKQARELIGQRDKQTFNAIRWALTSLVVDYDVQLPLRSLRFIFHPDRPRRWDTDYG